MRGLGFGDRLLTRSRGLGFGDRLLTSSRGLGFGDRLLTRVSIMGLIKYMTEGSIQRRKSASMIIYPWHTNNKRKSLLVQKQNRSM